VPGVKEKTFPPSLNEKPKPSSLWPEGGGGFKNSRRGGKGKGGAFSWRRVREREEKWKPRSQGETEPTRWDSRSWVWCDKKKKKPPGKTKRKGRPLVVARRVEPKEKKQTRQPKAAGMVSIPRTSLLRKEKRRKDERTVSRRGHEKEEKKEKRERKNVQTTRLLKKKKRAGKKGTGAWPGG